MFWHFSVTRNVVLLAHDRQTTATNVVRNILFSHVNGLLVPPNASCACLTFHDPPSWHMDYAQLMKTPLTPCMWWPLDVIASPGRMLKWPISQDIPKLWGLVYSEGKADLWILRNFNQMSHGKTFTFWTYYREENVTYGSLVYWWTAPSWCNFIHSREIEGIR